MIDIPLDILYLLNKAKDLLQETTPKTRTVEHLFINIFYEKQFMSDHHSDKLFHV